MPVADRRQEQATSGDVYLGDGDADRVAEAEAPSAATPDQDAARIVHFPAVVLQVHHLDQAIDQETRMLHEHAKRRDAVDQPLENFANVLRQQLKHLDKLQLPLGLLSATFGPRAMRAQPGHVLNRLAPRAT